VAGLTLSGVFWRNILDTPTNRIVEKLKYYSSYWSLLSSAQALYYHYSFQETVSGQRKSVKA